MKKKRQSLFNKMMENENFKKKFDEQRQFFGIEYQVAKNMDDHGITQKELAEKLGVDKSVVSKDMSGALKKAGIKRLQDIAAALDCEFVPLFVPGDKFPQ